MSLRVTPEVYPEVAKIIKDAWHFIKQFTQASEVRKQLVKTEPCKFCNLKSIKFINSAMRRVFHIG